MNREEILIQVQDVFRDVLDDETIVLNNETTAQDIEEWDSLTHIQLVVEVEKNFKVKFKAREILSWKNVGEMLDSIQSQTK